VIGCVRVGVWVVVKWKGGGGSWDPLGQGVFLVTLLQAFNGQTLAKGVRLLGKSTGSYGEPEISRGG